MDGEIKNWVRVWLWVLTSLCYCYFFVTKTPKGKLRLFSLLPIFFIFIILPLFLSYAFPVGIIAFLFSWLGNFKLLLFAFGKGPLSSHPSDSLICFILIACLPIKIKENVKCPSPQSPQSAQKSSTKQPKLPLNWPTKVLLFAILVSAHEHYEQYVHPAIVLLLYCCMVYFLIDIIFGISNGLVHATSGMELEQPSDEPYLSTSLQDFWGRRWNLTVTNLLRHTIYKPVRSFWENILGSKWAPLPAVLAAFLVSGLMHELLFYYVTRVNPTWEVTWYFLLHGVCVVVEFGLKRVFSSKTQLHWAVSTPLTVGFVMATAMWLFFPPLLKNGAVERVLEEINIPLKFCQSFIKSEMVKL